MVLRNNVAFDAGERGMMGNPLLAGNFTMAGAAFLGLMRQKGVVRIVARHASSARVM
jgi:hypothetical protein